MVRLTVNVKARIIDRYPFLATNSSKVSIKSSLILYYVPFINNFVFLPFTVFFLNIRFLELAWVRLEAQITKCTRSGNLCNTVAFLTFAPGSCQLEEVPHEVIANFFLMFLLNSVHKISPKIKISGF